MSRPVVACLAGLLSVLTLRGAEPTEGVLPVSAEGRPLNLDFETGTLADWTASGDAFKDQPIKGDTVASRRGDMRSQHQGQYWVGSYERHGDRPEGMLTSVPFKVTHPWASFLVGGGPHDVTCVELVRKDTGKVIHRASGLEEENLRREVVDLSAHQGKDIFIRLVDRHNGHWGHLNFDDFRFHTSKPAFPPRRAMSLDAYKYSGLSPEKAAAAMTVPEDFTVTLFAGEPDVRQPVALCLDDRGRVWVAEAHSYPIRRPEGQGQDRIVIFEDTDGDGKFDKRTVFLEGLNLVSGLEVGFGGVWIGAAPYLMFVPIKKGEDRPAGPPRILLDGWGMHDTHETLNTFSWGPDGWLYGCHGVFTHSRVGKPGTPDKQRVPINAGIWRYHPTRHVFEVFAHGTSNPWGLDFNDWGQAFCEACVIPHAFHIIQGARYQRQAGEHFNLHTYDDIKTIADHLHYLGANPHGGNNRSDSAGGGHAHCGTMIYLGGAWPASYRNQFFMGNIHGHRLNVDLLKPKGSGYVASHGPDFLLANDAWSRFINFRYGPDGNVYLIDWYDRQACHHGDPNIWDRSNGRIYKISYRGSKAVRADLSRLDDRELVKLQRSENDWFVRHARRLLQERGGSAEVHEALAQIAFKDREETRRLRGLWALHVSGGLTAANVEKGLSDPGAHVRAWTIQLALEKGTPSRDLLDKLAEMAGHDPSPVVRLYLASGLQRLGREQRWDILSGLLTHEEDAGDHNLPLMYWYAAEPLADLDSARALALAAKAKVPLLLSFMSRRIAAQGTPEAIALLVKTLAGTEEEACRRIILQGLNTALKGRRKLTMPAQWPHAYSQLSRSSDATVREQARALAVTFGDAEALRILRKQLADPGEATPVRQQALATLLAAADRELAPVLQRLVQDPALRSAALKGLAAYNDPRTPAVLLEAYPTLSSADKRDTLGTLSARPAYARALLDAVAARKIPAMEVSADVVRQLRNLHSDAIDKQIAEVWGTVRATPADRARQIAELRQKLTSGAGKPDLALGRAVFSKTCQQCHTLFGIGGKVGPDITGANRGSLDYLLENVLDPSAVIPREYAASLINLESGRVITGIVRKETPAALEVQTATETLTVPRDEIESRKQSDVSMMPEGLLQPLHEEEVRALFAYLQSPVQTPMLATAENARDFFNGKDLSGWDGDAKLWRVEDGTLIGKAPKAGGPSLLRSQMIAEDFRLSLKVKVTPGSAGGCIHVRRQLQPDVAIWRVQVRLGGGQEGKPRENILRREPARPEDWNDYEIVARGGRVRVLINGKSCDEMEDAKLPHRGIVALQIDPAEAAEIRFKDLRLEVLVPEKKGK